MDLELLFLDSRLRGNDELHCTLGPDSSRLPYTLRTDFWDNVTPPDSSNILYTPHLHPEVNSHMLSEHAWELVKKITILGESV